MDQVSASVYKHELDRGTQDFQPIATAFSSDCSLLVSLESSSDPIFQYALSTPYNITMADTTNPADTLDLNAHAFAPVNFVFSADAMRQFVLEHFDNVNREVLKLVDRQR